MNSRLPQIATVFDRRKRATPSRKGTVEIRITHNRKQVYISTGIYIYPNCWKNKEIVGTPEALELNQAIGMQVSEIRQVILSMITKGNINISSIPEMLSRLHTTSSTFIEYCHQRTTIRKYGKTKDSKERYDRFLRLFKEWGVINTFDDITEANIISYDRYLASKKLKPYSKWNNYHRFLNSFIMDAIDDGLIHRNPYKWLNIGRGDKFSIMKKYLTPEEFDKIKSVKLSTASLNKVRDVFIFQTYTCLSYADLKSFDFRRIKEIKGMKVYTGYRQKTGETFVIPLMREAVDILLKYNYILPIISNVNYNAYLKLVAQAAGIDKPISTHWARHTGATLLLNEGVDMQIVSKICGHSSTRITEKIYAKLLDETIVKAIKEIE